MSLSAHLTVQNIPLTTWSKTTIDYVLLQGDEMYLNAVNTRFVVPHPSLEFMSIDDLPNVVNVRFNQIYQICQTVTGSKAATMTRNSCDLPVVAAQNSSDLPVVVAQNSSDLPVVVARNSCDLPVMVAQNSNDLPTVVAQNSNGPPVVVGQNNGNLPMVVAQNTSNLPVTVHKIPTDISLPQNQKNSQIWTIHYGKELQGLVIADQQIESHYYDIHTSLLNTFRSGHHAIFILEGYMLAIIKSSIQGPVLGHLLTRQKKNLFIFFQNFFKKS